MPIYQYKCYKCGNAWIEFQRMNDVHLSECCEELWERSYAPDTLPYTHKDKAFEFERVDNHGRLVEIRSKKGYDKFLVNNNRVHPSKNEVSGVGRSKRHRDQEFAQKRKKCAERTAQRIQKEGLMDAFKTLGD